jgi:hypothetical protein
VLTFPEVFDEAAVESLMGDRDCDYSMMLMVVIDEAEATVLSVKNRHPRRSRSTD